MSPLDGASLIYNKIVLPLFIKNQSRIDNVLNRGREQLAGVSDKVVSEGKTKKITRLELQDPISYVFSAARIATEAESKKSE